jgi:PAS domain S-box-containing protein
MEENNRGKQSERAGASVWRGPATLEGMTAAWQETSDALRDSERRYRELVEYSLGLICTHDLSGTILSINPAAAISLGYQPGDGIGRNLREFLSAETRHLFEDYLLRIQEHGHDAGLMRVVTRIGAERVWMYRNVLSHGSGGIYVLGHAIDVTDRVAAERTLRQSEQALRTARSELEARVTEGTAALEQALTDQRETLTFLADFSDRLASLVTFADLIEALRRMPVPFLADWTMVYVVNLDGSMQLVPGIHADPTHEALLATLHSPTILSGSSSILGEVVATRRLAIVTSSTGDLTSRLLGVDCSADALERLGAKAAAMVPLVMDDKVAAVLCLVSSSPRYTSTDSLVVEDAAQRIRLALDRIQLYRIINDVLDPERRS